MSKKCDVQVSPIERIKQINAEKERLDKEREDELKKITTLYVDVVGEASGRGYGEDFTVEEFNISVYPNIGIQEPDFVHTDFLEYVFNDFVSFVKSLVGRVEAVSFSCNLIDEGGGEMYNPGQGPDVFEANVVMPIDEFVAVIDRVIDENGEWRDLADELS